MPIHDYRCTRCGRRFQQFFRTFAEVRDPSACPHCGAPDVARLPPRVRLGRSEESRLENPAHPSSLGDLDEKEPPSRAKPGPCLGREPGGGPGTGLTLATWW